MNACSVCGGNVQGIPALGTGVFVLYEGIIEVCQRCIVEAAAIYGLVDPTSLPDLQPEIDELRTWADDAYAELSARQGTIEALSAALARTAGERDVLRDLCDANDAFAAAVTE